MLLIIKALLLISPALEQDRRAAAEGLIYPFNMALDSVDDQYDGCTEEMAHLVMTEYLEKELNNSAQFKAAWQEAESNVSVPEDGLTKNHLIAIYVYTDKEVYRDFNSAVRREKENYKNMTYPWYSLHFLLTEALQRLKRTQKGCKSTYRGTDVEFDSQVLNTEVRFGSFASSSLNRSVAEGFGGVFCFEIYTCEGAEVANYSKFPDEDEVLIPPYETFKVSAVRNRTDDIDLWCQTVFTLESSGKISDLNCRLFNGGDQVAGFSVLLFLTILENVYLVTCR
ncbi:ecto-ADP-ribosyltransferase 5-like [Puntigrus tetrazona]|uniref:ecto-ADP-ribosyltransferase 5-like n=1 Tax=Puntigrus tetrazona TaxID=1606681 RepID=UPI001C897631|nr:ecto-ADP-ribosyltransferase 5-like [Puntigrus tetrazona]